MVAVIARILLRYLAAWLVTKGLFDAATGAQLGTDADLLGIVQTVLGLAIAAATEGWYWLARRMGWST